MPLPGSPSCSRTSFPKHSHAGFRWFRLAIRAVIGCTAVFAVTAQADSTIYIASSQASATNAGMTGTDTSIDVSGPANFQASGAASDSLLLVSTLQAALAIGNVTISAANPASSGQGRIVVVDAVSWASSHGLSFRAANCVEANGFITASAAAPIDFVIGPSTASVSCGGLTEAGVYVFKSLTSNGGNLGFTTSGGLAGSGQSIWFGSASTVLTTGVGTITVQTAATSPTANWLNNGVVEVGAGRIVADIGGRIDIGGYSGAELRGVGSNSTPITGGGQIDLRTRSGNVSLLAGQGPARIVTDGGGLRINAANALRLLGGFGSSAVATIVPNGDLRIDARALYAIAGSADFTDASLLYAGDGASTLINLAGNPSGLAQPATHSLYLAGATSAIAGSASAMLQIRPNIGQEASRVEVNVAQGDVVLEGGLALGNAYANLGLVATVANALNVQNGNLALLAGNSDQGDVFIRGSGSRLDLTINGSALLRAATAGRSSASIGTDPGLDFKVLGPNGNLSIIAGADGGIPAGSPSAGIGTQNGLTSIQQITVDQTLLLQGGAMPAFRAYIQGPTQTIRAGTLLIQDGAGGGVAAITNAGGNQDYPQSISVIGNATIGTATGAAGASLIDHGGAFPQTLVVGKSLRVNASGSISTRDFTTSVSTIVVDNENATRPARNPANTLVNNGTLDIRSVSRLHAVSPAAATLGSFVPAGTRYDHWYGEAAAVDGINYKSFVDGGFLPPQLLSVTRSGTGSGTVTSNPAGVNCGTACSATFAPNALVTLTATASAGSNFAGWSGACSGTASCTVTMDMARIVDAAFTLLPPPTVALSVVRSGTGSGKVTSSPAGIDCGATCGAAFALDTVVTLSASADAGSVFTGWSGACSNNSGSCSVTMSQSRTVNAAFEPLATTVPVPGPGNAALLMLALLLVGAAALRAGANRRHVWRRD